MRALLLPPLLLLLSACQPWGGIKARSGETGAPSPADTAGPGDSAPPGGDTGGGGDTAVDTGSGETGDTGGGFLEDCELDDPLHIDPMSLLYAFYFVGLDEVGFQLDLPSNIWDQATGSCPVYDGDGMSWYSLSGPCTLRGGTELEGSLRVEYSADWLFMEEDGLRLEHSGPPGDLYYAGDGNLSLDVLEDGSYHVELDLDLERWADDYYQIEESLQGSFVREMVVNWQVEGDVTTNVDFQAREQLRDNAVDLTGDYCAQGVLDMVEDCEDEPDGWVEVLGDRLGLLEYDGSVACDNCAHRSIDGVNVDDFCW